MIARRFRLVVALSATFLWLAPQVQAQIEWRNLRFGAQLTNGQLSLDDVRGADASDDTFFAGTYVDFGFNVRVGLWDDTGQFLGSTLGGSAFADLGWFENELILGVNGPGGLGTLYRLSDMSDPFSLSDLYGSNVSLVEDSFYNGSFGFIVSGSLGTYVTRYELSSIPEPAKGNLKVRG